MKCNFHNILGASCHCLLQSLPLIDFEVAKLSSMLQKILTSKENRALLSSKLCRYEFIYLRISHCFKNAKMGSRYICFSVEEYRPTKRETLGLNHNTWRRKRCKEWWTKLLAASLSFITDMKTVFSSHRVWSGMVSLLTLLNWWVRRQPNPVSFCPDSSFCFSREICFFYFNMPILKKILKVCNLSSKSYTGKFILI